MASVFGKGCETTMKDFTKKSKFRLYFNSERVYQIGLTIALIFLIFICIYPLIYVLSASFMSAEEWFARGGVFLIPHRPTIEAYRIVLSQTNFYKSLLVSAARSTLAPVLGTFMNAIAGYMLSRKDLVGKKFISIFLFITLIYGGGLIPSYLVIEATGLRNTFWVFIIPGILGAWGTLVFRQTFLSTPIEIEESAKLDGASELTLLFRIMLPINMPTVAVMLLFGAVGHWNAWFDAFMYIDSNNTNLIPVQLYLKNAFSSADQSTTGVLLHTETQKMVIAVIGIVPILCVYPFFQKYFTKGVYMGATKG